MTNEKLLLDALKEARELVEHWGAYASQYFQEKHDLAGDLTKLDDVIRAGEKCLQPAVEPSPAQWPEGRQLQIHAGADCKPIPFEMGVTYYACQHYPPDTMRRPIRAIRAASEPGGCHMKWSVCCEDSGLKFEILVEADTEEEAIRQGKQLILEYIQTQIVGPPKWRAENRT